ncbi:MAG: prevent-host-death protein [Spirochaetales bacterium]|nr:prevent-host-death protein [Spirochaetales bacterium]
MTYIKPSAAIRNDYNSISSLCKETEEPVYLTKNGEGDLVVMDIKAFDEREKVLKLREELLETEELRLRGMGDHSPEETLARMKDSLNNL